MNPIKTTPKDFFYHLAATIVLYSSVIALVNLAFAIINYSFPDPLAGYYYFGAVSWPIAVLIILVPVLFVLERLIGKDIKAMPEKDTLWIRRWRIYLTLFLTAATIVGDLIALLNTYFNGEISIRFFYKFLAILVIFAIVFAYYFLEKNNTRKSTQSALAWVGAAVVLITIIIGFMVFGSPYKQRAIRLDAQRLGHLQNLQWQVVNYWQTKEKLPATLKETQDPISGGYVPVDPDTNEPYTYNVKGDKSFELCANFALPTQDTKGRGEFGGFGGGFGRVMSSYPYPGDPENENWKHEAGPTCFTRTIDPERYPPFPKTRGM